LSHFESASESCKSRNFIKKIGPSFPIGSSTPRVPREYSTRRTTSGFNYQSVSSTTPTPFHQPSYSPTANILENLGVSGKSVSVNKMLAVFVLFSRGFE
jgi:hypothetical protein